ncbi:MAG: maltose alpha-D-glucosyltransferase [Acidobacteria bacterium]|nr:maltose alpha-D-glucosyltransferase [Acidobacteriota bacterium]
MKLQGSAQDPLWYKDAIIYETHVRAFFDGNNDGIGDFVGLTQKLDYLQDLGVTCLWLLPFFPSPLRDDGYDISDYCNIHPSYGTLEDFKQFMAAAHERGLQVLIELVINHTSDQHPWFQAARKAAPGSPERDFYVWSDSGQLYNDARIIFTDTEKSNWSWDPEAKAYYWHRFFSHQPDLNFDNPAVLDEVLKAMRFWLDLGVDGMRLDAIPYLIERDGTNCENLAETHAVIKAIRREMDAGHSGRMLLAEANQWPSDVREYFGDGDECHMAFHFPLMPRIFMALRLEDRHPITEIIAQTPDIPETCQWGLFLRNHDELTLEMVTADERDYMYLAYSADPQTRINVGIRRRLAPLMDNNLRRIELMNSLLFSFPGTPVIYYGDEIGMGDNIYLGDRNGVRTPMQWTGDRNGGFSRTNPARLFSPPIMDPIYGYEAVNVEAQQTDASSLLHWMRNMIALRKLFRVFGRGTLEFLAPENRKVLAYVRKYQDDQVLCVANLSRFSQPVELDLSSLAGMTPVEMLGFTEFPRIGREGYRLTLAAYGFFWFELQGQPEPAEAPAEAAPVVLVLSADCESLFVSGNRAFLESVALPDFLPKQRWFGAKARRIETTRILDWSWLLRGDSPCALTLVEVSYSGGGHDTYFLPLGISLGHPADALAQARPDAVVVAVRHPSGSGILHDGLADDGACLALLDAIEQRREHATNDAVFRAFSTAQFDEARGTDTGPLKVARSSAEQSNTSILYGGRLILKLFRRLEEGPNPDLEIGRYLTEQASLVRIPRLAGGMEYARLPEGTSAVAMLQELVDNQGDGWKSTMEELSRYYERATTFRASLDETPTDGRPLVELSEEEIPAAEHDRIGIYLDSAATLGRRTGELHLALGAETANPDFAPEPLTPDDLEKLLASLREHAAHVFDVLRASLPSLPEDIVDRAALTLSQRSRLIDRFRGLERAGINAARIRIHGDYHLGQVLSVKNDFVLLDFEGEPARSLEHRRAKQPALKDLAGMLRSFSYAAYAGLLNHTARRADEYEHMFPCAALWEKWTSVAFLRAYRDTTRGAAFLPADSRPFQQLLDAFLLDKALYELSYELNNRPAWVRIPLQGILGFIGFR